MISFINAKLNLGLNIVNRRPDGYHDLETIFYPVGKYNGTPQNPEPFCDILEITPADKTEFFFTGREVNCPLEKNLVYKAWKLFKDNYPGLPEYAIRLEKHLPDGAGLGGGSADATFVLRMLNELNGSPFSDSQLEDMALKLGADCPFFVCNTPCYAEGVGEKMHPIDLDLSGWWCALVKPNLSISTKEAFAGVTPRYPEINLREIVKFPVDEWNGLMKNDFEESLFPNHPQLAEIKAKMLALGASYAAMSGSGSTIFGLFPSRSCALSAIAEFPEHYTTVCKM
ncbi:MAG: 4-(cytidine 5'-diphospho)-2-C-methyl-D-erythritol kinase [Muribaculum sp.]|nr:4-(cytidine 5'-diphospho)-2-C-methyl-D-erythritol kinase [Muribaculum sp.]